MSTASGVGQQDPLEPLASAASTAASGVWQNTLVGSTRCLTCSRQQGEGKKMGKAAGTHLPLPMQMMGPRAA